jgi:uncharacterized membrane protein
MSVTIPNLPLPFEIPDMIHPMFVHFAIALPVILLILELINLVAKKRVLTAINIFFMILIPVILLATYLTGAKDATNIDTEALEAHKQLGVYLVYGSGIVLLFKLISTIVNKIQIKIFFYLALVALIATTFIEGKRGGELVYKYGVNVKATNKSDAVKKPEQKAATKQNSASSSESNDSKSNKQDAKEEATNQELNTSKVEQNTTNEQNSTKSNDTATKQEGNQSMQKEQNITKEEPQKSLDSNSTFEHNTTKTLDKNITNELNATVTNPTTI